MSSLDSILGELQGILRPNYLQQVGDVIDARSRFGKGVGLPLGGTEGIRPNTGGSGDFMNVLKAYRGPGMEGEAQGVVPFPAKRSSVPPLIEDVYARYLRGEVRAGDVQKVVKDHGWYLDLRSKAGPPEIFDPSGRSHDLDY